MKHKPITSPVNGEVAQPVTDLQKPALLQLRAQVFSPLLPKFEDETTEAK